MVIVKKIFQHKEIELPVFQSEEDAANHLGRLFKQIGPDPILLVLNDVLPGSESTLHNLNFRIENYKILKLAFPLDQQSYAPDQEILEETEKYSLQKVLVLHNYGFVPAELTNFPLLRSLSNLKRIRLEKVSIPSLFLTSMKWRKLEKMSLVMCNIHQAFNKSTNKISDAFPKLVDLTIDYCNDLEELPTGFCDLVLLRKLSITKLS
ncbi:hypothetical protein NC651_018003 [Populus alba x Populus x berolinensis]|nr:hypothetical protein NC651_018003 [Populus alba x Populus x berolinensis]